MPRLSPRLRSGKASARVAPAPADVSVLRLAEEALQESESRFRTLADAAPVMIWMSGVDRGCTWCNQNWLNFTGRTLAEVLGDGWAEAVHPDDVEHCRDSYHGAFDRGEPFEMEYRLRRADGQFRWFLDRGLPRYGAARAFLGYIGTCIDVTRLKETEDDLNRAQSVGHIGSWRLDVRRNELTWSRENHRIFGVPEGTPLTYETFLQRVHPQDVDLVDRMWSAALRGAPYDIEHRLLVGGEVKWVREKAELEFDAQGNLRGGFGITQDITEIKLARRAMQEIQDRFLAFMSHGPAGSWIVDAEGRYVYASPGYYEMFRVGTTDLIGKHIGEIYPPEIAAKYLKGNQQVIASKQPIESVMPGLRPDGSAGEFLVVKFSIADANNRPLICGMALDVTEQRRATAALRIANTRLENSAGEQAQHLRQLADDLTWAEQRERDRLYELLHDDVQPLLVAARLSLSSLSPRTPVEDCLRVAAEACEHIGQVIDVARTLSRQLSPPLIRESGLNPALASLCSWMKSYCGLSVELNCGPEPEPDDVAIRLLCFGFIRELLLNVVKHAGVASAVLALSFDDRDSLRIVVTDQGVGFDPSAVGKGTGLGEIARRLGMIGGALNIDSQPGAGATVTMRVPLRPVKGEATAAGRPRQNTGE
ncbi:MAG TPA: PAS domain S-box protein [Rhodocyclaceae bacterium]|nr:PAS domain S-box protein [Rhodocyclaceae bacterium]